MEENLNTLAGQPQQDSKNYWLQTIVSFLVVLFIMPIGHIVMIVMEKTMEPVAVHYAGFAIGFVGMVLTIIGVFVKGDLKQTLYGLFGALFFWTGWVEFLFQYYANRFGTQPELGPGGEVITKPEYLILPASFGMWMMVMMLYTFSTRNGCDFITWIQKKCFGRNFVEVVGHPMTRHTSIVTFMEFNMIMWGCYLLLMFCYDPVFLGDHHPVTFLIGFGCLVGSIFMFRSQLHIKSWGANIRMAIATVIVFWTPVEILGRVDFFEEIWVKPEEYKAPVTAIIIAFLVLVAYLIYKARTKKRKSE